VCIDPGCINDVKNVRQFIVERYGFPTSRDSMVRKKTAVDREIARLRTLILSSLIGRSSSPTRDTRTLLIGPPKRTSFVG
jgi:hypothetical protein